MSRPLDPRLLRAVPAMRPYLSTVTACQLISACLVIAQAVLLATAVTTVFVHHDFGAALTIRLALLATVGVGRAVIAASLDALSGRASLRIRSQLRAKTLDALLRLGPVAARRYESGRLATITGPGLDGLDGYVSRALPALVNAAVTPAAVLVTITVTDWQSGLLLLVMLPLVPVFMALVGVTTKRRVQRQYVLLGRLAGHFLDLLRGLTTLRVYGQAERQEQTLAEATERYRRETMSALRITFLSALVLDLVAALSVAVVAVDIGLRLDGRDVSFATALVVLFLAPELFNPLRAMGAQFHANEEGSAASGACLDLIAQAPRGEAAREIDPRHAAGTVALDGASVHYAGRDVPALDDVHFTVQPGELVVLSGRSGAGKSTVLAGLLGFVTPVTGAVIVGVGQALVELRDLDASSWRQCLAWVPQRPVPTQRTVADEVRLGDESATDDDIDSVCGQCHTPDPATRLGEDGRWVSAGQRRRIALARAVLRARAVRHRGGVPLVLLDEPSEDLDRQTEEVVAAVVESLRGWATVMIATHSPVLTTLAERLITLDHGRVVANVRQVPTTFRPTVHDRLAATTQPTSARRVDEVSRPLRLRELVATSGVRRRLLRAAGLSAAAGLAGLALTGSSTWLISRAAQHPNVQALAIAVVGVRTFALARALLRYLERLASHDVALRLLTRLRVQVFAALRPLGQSALSGYGRGDLLRRFVGDVDGVQDALVRTFIPIAGAAATGVGAVIVAGLLAPAAGLALAISLTLAGAVLPLLALRASGSQNVTAELVGRRDAHAAALTEALDELTAYGADRRAVASIAALDTRIESRSRRRILASSTTTLMAGALAAITLPVALLLGAHAVRSGHLPLVDLAVLAVCTIVGFEAVSPLPAALAAWTRCRAGLDRVAEVLSAQAIETDGQAAVPAGRLGLRGDALEVAPAVGAAAVVRNADLAVPVGSRVAITGPSGCGKSTLLASALCQLEVSTGHWDLVGDQLARPVTEVASALLTRGIAGSLQGDHVFDATLRDNLRVVLPSATDDDLDTVARRVGLVEFIAELPAGWSTPAGPDGSGLSGGQRQRLLLARALLADPAVLVLDEPTAHLDLETERAVLTDLLDATAGRTVLLTTHRAIVPGDVDQILRLSGGQLERVCTLVPARPVGVGLSALHHPHPVRSP